MPQVARAGLGELSHGPSRAHDGFERLALFVVPAVYSLVARRTRPGQYTSRLVDRMLGGKGQAPGEVGTGPAAGVAGGG